MLVCSSSDPEYTLGRTKRDGFILNIAELMQTPGEAWFLHTFRQKKIIYLSACPGQAIPPVIFFQVKTGPWPTALFRSLGSKTQGTPGAPGKQGSLLLGAGTHGWA